ncbi:Innexin [Paragonimus heterotremus]|uniref:Innexin n=1 Tax=Paragonimus heterotremus TaxID=100268 RepID=A0A8J4T3X6_9TREM|nr:Innexin [Paragonimus heterotremus]
MIRSVRRSQHAFGIMRQLTRPILFHWRSKAATHFATLSIKALRQPARVASAVVIERKTLGTMVGSEFLDYISKLQVATYVGVEDFADKFNFLITVTILLLCTTVVTVKQYMMKPISCYMATDIGGKNLLDYVENYCWVQGTVPIAYAGRVPETDAGWEELEKQKLCKFDSVLRFHFNFRSTIRLPLIFYLGLPVGL